VTSPTGARFYPPSCFNLSRQYLAGRGVEKSDSGAYRALERSCDQAGHVGACHHLGVMLLSGGDGVRKQEGRGARCLERACGMGDVTSCHAVASVLLSEGKYPGAAKEVGDEKERRERIISALDKGCKGGYAPSCFNLAGFYKKEGDQVNFNIYKAITEGLVKSGNGSGVGKLQGGLNKRVG
jgi:TPR repeat protein